METLAEAGGSDTEAKNAGSHQKVKEAKNKVTLEASGGSVVLLMPLFQTSDPQNCERINFCSFKLPNL